MPCSSRRERRRILILEDDRRARESLSRIFDRAGYEVVACRNMAEAYATMATRYGPFDVALIDIMLPDGCGADLVHDLRKLEAAYRRGRTRIVIMTACLQDDLRVTEAFQNGADRYVKKPIDLEVLFPAVEGLPEVVQIEPQPPTPR